MSEEINPKAAVDLPTEFDSPTFVGASAANSIAVSRFEEAYRGRPPWDIDGPQPQLARLLDDGLIQGRVLDVGCGTGENALRLAELAETFDSITDSGLLHVFSDQDIELLIRGVHAVLRPAGLYWLMCFSEHATFPGPRRLTQQHIATFFKDGWRIRSIDHAQFEVIAGRAEDECKIAAAWLAGIERL